MAEGKESLTYLSMRRDDGELVEVRCMCEELVVLDSVICVCGSVRGGEMFSPACASVTSVTA